MRRAVALFGRGKDAEQKSLLYLRAALRAARGEVPGELTRVEAFGYEEASETRPMGREEVEYLERYLTTQKDME